MLKLLTLTVFFGFFSNLVLAQNSLNWPSKPVRVIVAGTGGSATDMVARMFTEPLSKTFGQAFIIDNKLLSHWFPPPLVGLMFQILTFESVLLNQLLPEYLQ